MKIAEAFLLTSVFLLCAKTFLTFYILEKELDLLSKHPSNHQTPSITKHRTNIGCIVCGGVSSAKLLQLIRKSPADTQTEVDFRLRFAAYDSGKAHTISYREGLLIFVNIYPSQLHLSKPGEYHIRGTISRIPQASRQAMQFGSFHGHSDKIPFNWFQEGSEIQPICHGAANNGLVISITDPIKNEKLCWHT